MSTASLLTSLCGIALSLILGMLFSAMESGVLALNRTRLMELFGDEHPELVVSFRAVQIHRVDPGTPVGFRTWRFVRHSSSSTRTARVSSSS